MGRLFKAIEADDASELSECFRLGACPNRSINFMSPLQLAIARGHLSSIRILHERGATINRDHLEQVSILKFLYESNRRESQPDILFTDLPQTAEGQARGYQRAIDHYDEINRYLTEHMPRERR